MVQQESHYWVVDIIFIIKKTSHPWGLEVNKIYKDLVDRLTETTFDFNAGFYFGQRLCIALQRENVTSILGTLPSMTEWYFF